MEIERRLEDYSKLSEWRKRIKNREEQLIDDMYNKEIKEILTD